MKDGVRNALLGLGLALALIFSFWPAWKELVSAWAASEEYSHGFLVIPVAVFMVWKQRAILRGMPFCHSNFGFAVFAASLVVYVLSYYAGIQTLIWLSVVLTIWGIVISLCGYNFAKALLTPLIILLFMIPIPAQIYSILTVPLQLLVSEVSVSVSFLLGVPAYHEGNIIFLPERVLNVVGACSGVRSMVSMLVVGTVVGYFNLIRRSLRLILILSVIPITILMNILRVLLVSVALYYMGLDLTVGGGHTGAGIFVFLASLVLLLRMQVFIARWDG